MLAIAVCVSLPPSPAGAAASAATAAPPSASSAALEHSGERLFRMAESSLHQCRQENRVDLIQALILLSLRQTGCGDKRGAFAYAGRACCMALNLGLNLAPTSKAISSTDTETRARVYWNCYVLDKVLAEETGRSCLLSYRRTTVPLPSAAEADELETWPPPSTSSSSPPPRSVAHVAPRRGHVMSYFAWTCRLGMVVEDALALDVQRPTPTVAWDDAFLGPARTERDARADAQRLGEQLDVWRAALPAHLEVDMGASVSPMPHHVINLAWYHTSKILIFSRFVKRSPPGHGDPWCARAHAICSEAAQASIDLFAHLDRHKLLNQNSSDIVHLLCLATLFTAFDSTDADDVRASRARLNFAQCCIWLRDFSSAWPAASAHKLFFEGLIQGGLKMSAPDDGDDHGRGGGGGDHDDAADSPSVSDGLRQMGRSLVLRSTYASPSASFASPTSMLGSALRPGSAHAGHASSALGAAGQTGLGGSGPGSASALFQLPQFYWNSLSTGTGGAGAMASSLGGGNDGGHGPGANAITVSGGGAFAGLGNLAAGQRPLANGGLAGHGAGAALPVMGASPLDWLEAGSAGDDVTAAFAEPTGPGVAPAADWLDLFASPAVEAQPPSTATASADSAAIYAALMSYMADAARTQ